MSIDLYTSVESACAQKVRLVLAEKKLDWQEQYLNLRKGEQFSTTYLQLNPKAVVPTLVHDGCIIRESSVINEYLDEVFPEPALKPDNPGLRSQMRLWVKTVDDEVHPAIGVLTYAMVLRNQMNEMKTPEQLERHFLSVRDPKRRERQQLTHKLGVASPAVKPALGQLKLIIMQMDQVLSGSEWLAGERYSLADAAFAPYMVRLELLNCASLWQNRSHFNNWLIRIKTRNSVARLKDPWGSKTFIKMAKEYTLASSDQISCLLQSV